MQKGLNFILTNDELFWLYLNNRESFNVSQFADVYFKYENLNNFKEAILDGSIKISIQCKNEILNNSWKEQCYKIIDYMDKRNIRVILFSSKLYPEKLKHINDPPPILYYIGDVTLFDMNCVAIIGSRVSSSYGRKCAENFSGVLSQHDICIVSGMADGIDSYAQWAALNNNGATIAVLGNGVDVIYPQASGRLYDEICKKGLVVSEFPLVSKPQKSNFTYRNRLIAGLSDCLVVAEAGLPSGTMSTVDYALDQGKNVYAIPGSINSPTSAGTNYLIKTGALCAIEPYDILVEFGKYKINKDEGAIPYDEELDTLQNDILKLLYVESLTFEQLEEALLLDADQLNMALTMLEICGYVEQEAGRTYSLIR